MSVIEKKNWKSYVQSRMTYSHIIAKTKR